MNRRSFLKTIGMVSIASLIPFNLKADDVHEIDTVSLSNIKDKTVKFNGVLNVSTFSKNERITTFFSFFGDDTKEKLSNYYKSKHNKNAWFLNNDTVFVEDLEFSSEDLFQSYEYRIYGYYGISPVIKLDCKMDNKYVLRYVDFRIGGISSNVEKIIISDYLPEEKYKIYPMIHNYYSNLLFGLTFDEINKTNIKSIGLPKNMFEENKKYISIIEKETNIKFSVNNG